ncbi:hypothetical protein FIBSPDRAFT_884962 [Athelia psychrophila]|uniref:CxC2-like cysteine cluster KDZ transposase-associated domain-containing protein n=1 Tax=Athelia psychrophila TaxID=1759441 RepID=A0A166SL23_9AGAM|nr:hypothetical protein FIBSPDRAFT_884962 [Fibularhizoctonia sp. CBS 109695]
MLLDDDLARLYQDDPQDPGEALNGLQGSGEALWEDDDVRLPRRATSGKGPTVPCTHQFILNLLAVATLNVQYARAGNQPPSGVLTVSVVTLCAWEKWNGDCFTQTSLLGEGYILHLGHGGLACPCTTPDASAEGVQYSQTVTLVAVNGFFKHNVAWCHCLVEGKRVSAAMQLFTERLFPATHTRPETAFTFDLLDYFWVDMMECKTANQSFIRKLGKITNPDFPEDSPLYHQLMYCSRSYRDLLTRVTFGYGHEQNKEPGEGGLALFCPACPQPGYNLPDNWENDPAQFAYKRQIVNDVNVKAQNSHSAWPEQDVCLYDAKDTWLQNNLTRNIYRKNHKAQNSAERNPRNLRASGIAACACARHGCFVPNSVVDFQVGEQTHGLPGALDIYNINCQYCKNFWAWIKKWLEELGLPENINEKTLMFAVGSFHLSAHVPECFSQFSLHFIKEIGNIDGEILETLWAAFNNISPMCRPMTGSQWREIYDNFMRDSNWKKMVNIVKTLNKKLKRAENALEETHNAFKGLNEGLDSQLIAKWTKSETKAMDMRGSHLKYYDIASTMGEIKMVLLDGPRTKNLVEGSVSWLASGITLEGEQDKLGTDTRRLLSIHATIPAKTAFAHRLARLRGKVRRFQQESLTMLGVDDEKEVMLRLAEEDLARTNLDLDEEGWGQLVDMELNSDAPGMEDVLDGDEDRDDEEPSENEVRPDRPSGGGGAGIVQGDYCFGQQSEMQMAPRQRQGLSMASQGSGERSKPMYGPTDPALPKQYQPIGKGDLRTADVTDERRPGQSTDNLAWFWKLGAEKAGKHEWTEEYYLLKPQWAVYRVSWLRAKARKSRWWEEGIIISHEMLFVILFHVHEAECHE